MSIPPPPPFPRQTAPAAASPPLHVPSPPPVPFHIPSPPHVPLASSPPGGKPRPLLLDGDDGGGDGQNHSPPPQPVAARLHLRPPSPPPLAQVSLFGGDGGAAGGADALSDTSGTPTAATTRPPSPIVGSTRPSSATPLNLLAHNVRALSAMAAVGAVAAGLALSPPSPEPAMFPPASPSLLVSSSGAGAADATPPHHAVSLSTEALGAPAVPLLPADHPPSILTPMRHSGTSASRPGSGGNSRLSVVSFMLASVEERNGDGGEGKGLGLSPTAAAGGAAGAVVRPTKGEAPAGRVGRGGRGAGAGGAPPASFRDRIQAGRATTRKPTAVRRRRADGGGRPRGRSTSGGRGGDGPIRRVSRAPSTCKLMGLGPAGAVMVVGFVALFHVKVLAVVQRRRAREHFLTVTGPRAAFVIQCCWRRRLQQERARKLGAVQFLQAWLRFRMRKLRRRRETSARLLQRVFRGEQTRALMGFLHRQMHFNFALGVVRRFILRWEAQITLRQLKLRREERNVLVEQCHAATLRLLRAERAEFLTLAHLGAKATGVRTLVTQADHAQQVTALTGCSITVAAPGEERVTAMDPALAYSRRHHSFGLPFPGEVPRGSLSGSPTPAQVLSPISSWQGLPMRLPKSRFYHDDLHATSTGSGSVGGLGDDDSSCSPHSFSANFKGRHPLGAESDGAGGDGAGGGGGGGGGGAGSTGRRGTASSAIAERLDFCPPADAKAPSAVATSDRARAFLDDLLRPESAAYLDTAPGRPRRRQTPTPTTTPDRTDGADDDAMLEEGRRGEEEGDGGARRTASPLTYERDAGARATIEAGLLSHALVMPAFGAAAAAAAGSPATATENALAMLPLVFEAVVGGTSSPLAAASPLGRHKNGPATGLPRIPSFRGCGAGASNLPRPPMLPPSQSGAPSATTSAATSEQTSPLGDGNFWDKNNNKANSDINNATDDGPKKDDAAEEDGHDERAEEAPDAPPPPAWEDDAAESPGALSPLEREPPASTVTEIKGDEEAGEAGEVGEEGQPSTEVPSADVNTAVEAAPPAEDDDERGSGGSGGGGDAATPGVVEVDGVPVGDGDPLVESVISCGTPQDINTITTTTSNSNARDSEAAAIEREMEMEMDGAGGDDALSVAAMTAYKRHMEEQDRARDDAVLGAFVDLLCRTESIERRALEQSLLREHTAFMRPVQLVSYAIHLSSALRVPPLFAPTLLAFTDFRLMRLVAGLFVEEQRQRITLLEEYDAQPLEHLTRPVFSVAAETRHRTLVSLAEATHDPLDAAAVAEAQFFRDVIRDLLEERQRLITCTTAAATTGGAMVAAADSGDAKNLVQLTVEHMARSAPALMASTPKRRKFTVKMGLSGNVAAGSVASASIHRPSATAADTQACSHSGEPVAGSAVSADRVSVRVRSEGCSTVATTVLLPTTRPRLRRHHGPPIPLLRAIDPITAAAHARGVQQHQQRQQQQQGTYPPASMTVATTASGGMLPPIAATAPVQPTPAWDPAAAPPTATTAELTRRLPVLGSRQRVVSTEAAAAAARGREASRSQPTGAAFPAAAAHTYSGRPAASAAPQRTSSPSTGSSAQNSKHAATTGFFPPLQQQQQQQQQEEGVRDASGEHIAWGPLAQGTAQAAGAVPPTPPPRRRPERQRPSLFAAAAPTDNGDDDGSPAVPTVGNILWAMGQTV